MTTRIVTENDIEKLTCPGCKANIEIERDKPTHRILEHDHDSETNKKLDAVLEAIKADKKPPEEKKPETVLQTHVPGYHCGPDCEKIHKNKNHKARPKGKCKNCEQFSNVGKGKCPWCADGEIEKIDDDDLDVLGIIRPDVHGGEE